MIYLVLQLFSWEQNKHTPLSVKGIGLKIHFTPYCGIWFCEEQKHSVSVIFQPSISLWCRLTLILQETLLFQWKLSVVVMHSTGVVGAPIVDVSTLIQLATIHDLLLTNSIALGAPRNGNQKPFFSPVSSQTTKLEVQFPILCRFSLRNLLSSHFTFMLKYKGVLTIESWKMICE